MEFFTIPAHQFTSHQKTESQHNAIVIILTDSEPKRTQRIIANTPLERTSKKITQGGRHDTSTL